MGLTTITTTTTALPTAQGYLQTDQLVKRFDGALAVANGVSAVGCAGQPRHQLRLPRLGAGLVDSLTQRALPHHVKVGRVQMPLGDEPCADLGELPPRAGEALEAAGVETLEHGSPRFFTNDPRVNHRQGDKGDHAAERDEERPARQLLKRNQQQHGDRG